jgi:hypothetical protein
VAPLVDAFSIAFTDHLLITAIAHFWPWRHEAAGCHPATPRARRAGTMALEGQDGTADTGSQRKSDLVRGFGRE